MIEWLEEINEILFSKYQITITDIVDDYKKYFTESLTPQETINQIESIIHLIN